VPGIEQLHTGIDKIGRVARDHRDLVECFDGRVCGLAFNLTQRLDNDPLVLGEFGLRESADFAHGMDRLPKSDGHIGRTQALEIPTELARVGLGAPVLVFYSSSIYNRHN